jgi:hypothetical protein
MFFGWVKDVLKFQLSEIMSIKNRGVVNKKLHFLRTAPVFRGDYFI